MLRFLIREMISDDQNKQQRIIQPRTVARRIAPFTDGIFKDGSTDEGTARLTLVNRDSRPFKGLEPEEIDRRLVGYIKKAGYEIEDVFMPGGGSTSSAYDMYRIYDPNVDEAYRQYHDVIFGTAHSGAESTQFVSIDQSVKGLTDNKSNPIEVFDGEDYVTINDAVRVGTKNLKPDVILTLNGDVKLSISLKHLPGGRATEMQQWGGLIKYKDHPEVVDFVECIKRALNSGSSKKRFYRDIKDETLKYESMWGTPGNMVDVIVAGSVPILVPSEDRPGAFKIAFRNDGPGTIAYRKRGDTLGPEFEPVMMARPSSDRGFGGLEKYRVMTFPKQAAQTSGTLDMCSIGDKR